MDKSGYQNRKLTDMRRRFTARQARQLWIAADGKCQSCGDDLPNQFHVHHVSAHANGGPTQLYNGMVLCVPCHRKLT